MGERKRDYRAEYRRRIANAKKRGLSRSQARGHAKPGETPIKPKVEPKAIDDTMESIRKALQNGASLARAAQAHGVSRERARRYIATHGIAKFEGGKWIITDERPVNVPIVSKGGQIVVRVSPNDASLAGHYANATRNFLNTNDVGFLKPYRGKSVKDVRTGRKHKLETDPNALHRAATADEPSFPEIYQIVAE